MQIPMVLFYMEANGYMFVVDEFEQNKTAAHQGTRYFQCQLVSSNHEVTFIRLPVRMTINGDMRLARLLYVVS